MKTMDIVAYCALGLSLLFGVFIIFSLRRENKKAHQMAKDAGLDLVGEGLVNLNLIKIIEHETGYGTTIYSGEYQIEQNGYTIVFIIPLKLFHRKDKSEVKLPAKANLSFSELKNVSFRLSKDANSETILFGSV